MFGLVAAILCIGSFIPQVIKCWKTKQTSDISLATYIAMSAGVSCWVIHGWVIEDPAVAVSNAIFLPLVLSILALKLKFG